MGDEATVSTGGARGEPSMQVRHDEDPAVSEARYDPETAGKIAALAARLQSQAGETLTAGEIETIGTEVGLKPGFVRQAVLQFNQRKTAAIARPPRSPSPQILRARASIWWTTAWAIPLTLFFIGLHTVGAPTLLIYFFPGVAVYAGVGLALSLPADAGSDTGSGKLLRAQLLEMLFVLQAELEGQKQHRAFLSVDVVDSSGMKRQGPDLAVEYSFGQLRQWVEEVVRAEGGEMQSAAGDGVMCVLSTDLGAVRAARHLQEGLAQFNAAHNRLPTPFRIRCGVSAGEVAIEAGTPLGHLQSSVIDRAAVLQKQAAPGEILIGEELADAALAELGSLSRLPEPVAGSPAFCWRSGSQLNALPEAGKPV
jgi:class 3 adenylate cyclase